MALHEALPEDIKEIAHSCAERSLIVDNDGMYLHCFQIPDNGKALLIMIGVETLTQADKKLLRIFVENAGQAFHNMAIRKPEKSE